MLAREFVDGGVVAIGWREAGDYTRLRSKEEVVAAVKRAYPDRTDQQSHVSAGQIWRFLVEIKIGDSILTYDPSERLYHLGVISGHPRYEPAVIGELPVQRAVTWNATVSRDALSPAARGKLGAILTLFRVADSTAAELVARASGGASSAPIEAGSKSTIGDDDLDSIGGAVDPFVGLQDQAVERIKDRLLGLDWEEMQEMVAALLRALGYRTIVSPAGPDRGKDIVASRDGFGFEPPRIVVEVKHRRGPMGAPEIRAFLGGRHAEDRGLYVSTGGFSREAHFEAERAATVTHLMTLDGLARALIDNYDKLDERGRTLLPLVKLYWPA